VASNDIPDEQAEPTSSQRPRTAAEEQAEQTAAKGGSDSPDPDELAADIGRTREELAETIDAIADKVSPKKVAQRTSDHLKEEVREGAQSASQSIRERASSAADSVKEGASSAADSVKEGASSAADSVRAGVAAVKDKVAERRGDDEDASPLSPATSVELGSAVPVDGLGDQEPAGTPLLGLAGGPHRAASSPGTTPKPVLGPSGLPTTVLGAPTPVVAGAGGGALLLAGLWLRRRRKRRRGLR